MDQTERFLPPFLEPPLIIIRLLPQSERFVFNNAKAPGRGEVNRAFPDGDGMHPVVRQPTPAREILKLSARHANHPARRANPEIIGKTPRQTGRVLVTQPLFAAQRGQGHAAQDPEAAIGGDEQAVPHSQQVTGGLGGKFAPIPNLVGVGIVKVFAPELAAVDPGSFGGVP